MSHDKNEERVKGMNEEIKSLHENFTYGLVKLLKGKMALKNK